MPPASSGPSSGGGRAAVPSSWLVVGRRARGRRRRALETRRARGALFPMKKTTFLLFSTPLTPAPQLCK